MNICQYLIILFKFLNISIEIGLKNPVLVVTDHTQLHIYY